jgi:hypothetical protein
MAKIKMPHKGHDKHLCYLQNLGIQMRNPEEYKALVRNGKFVCKLCGRVAANKINLCRGVKL